MDAVRREAYFAEAALLSLSLLEKKTVAFSTSPQKWFRLPIIQQRKCLRYFRQHFRPPLVNNVV
jgi:hypothetical protein